MTKEQDKEQEAKQNRVMGIDPVAFAAFQATQAGATALSAREGEAALGADVSRRCGVDEAAFQAWVAKEKAAGRGCVPTTLGARDALGASGEGGSAFLTIPFPRAQ